MTTPSIERARRYSDAKLAELRAGITAVVPPGVAVIACGSYARREASATSDFDYFAITAPGEAPDRDATRQWTAELKTAVSRIVGVEPAKDGAFGALETADGMVRNIGGQHDDNAKLTRRMLFLLEGAALSAPQRAGAVRDALVARYLRAGTDDGLALFLLDDIVRYYRTIAVDYEFKTSEGDRPKAWGLRNVKLMFSRKLLYASGLFAVGAVRDTDAKACAARLLALFDMDPLARLQAICGPGNTAGLLALYDVFLARLADREGRGRLEAMTEADRQQPAFLAIRAEGRAFSAELLRLFGRTFAPDHPVHRSMLF